VEFIVQMHFKVLLCTYWWTRNRRINFTARQLCQSR